MQVLRRDRRVRRRKDHPAGRARDAARGRERRVCAALERTGAVLPLSLRRVHGEEPPDAALDERKGLAEFAPAGANKAQSIFAGGVYVGKNTFLTSSTEGETPPFPFCCGGGVFPVKVFSTAEKCGILFLYLLEQGAMPL